VTGRVSVLLHGKGGAALEASSYGMAIMTSEDLMTA
jgi:hypothetical protein